MLIFFFLTNIKILFHFHSLNTAVITYMIPIGIGASLRLVCVYICVFVLIFGIFQCFNNLLYLIIAHVFPMNWGLEIHEMLAQQYMLPEQ